MLKCSKQNCRNIVNLSFCHLDFGNLNLPFDFAQDRESFDFAQDREPVERPVERLVEPFRISIFDIRIYLVWCYVLPLERHNAFRAGGDHRP
jgi:hypothetical protein